jgi:hypothetical protein
LHHDGIGASLIGLCGGGVEQYFRIGNRLRKRKLRRIVEADPVIVDQDVDIAQRFFELCRSGKIVAESLDTFSE